MSDACYEAGYLNGGSIGDYSCNGGDHPCAVRDPDIGDCEENADAVPAPCASIDFAVTKSASETSLPAGGGSVRFDVTVTNRDPFEIELTSLEDSVFGDLDGRGGCSTPQSIVSGDSYTCSFREYIDAAHTDTVTAEATDEVNNSGSRSDTVTVSVAQATATPTATTEPMAAPEEELPTETPGPSAAEILIRQLSQRTATSTPAATATAVVSQPQGNITPPNTGDGGLADHDGVETPEVLAGLVVLSLLGTLVCERRASR